MPQTENHNHHLPANCSFSQVTLEQAAANSVSGDWDLPDFQRGFVWRPKQVALMLDSLWRNYPIGSILIWKASDAGLAPAKRAWIADGQQRLTALCLLFGRKPQWWERRAPSEWERMRIRHDIRFDVEGGDRSRFVVGTPDLDPCRFIPLPELLEIDPANADGTAALGALAARIKSRGYCGGRDEEEVTALLCRVASLRSMSTMVTAVEHELREVLEIFDRLNSRGMKFRKVLLTTMRQTLSGIFRTGWMDPAMREFRQLKPR